eukprot:6526469-Lingulodinium_polyedra.AAC.1
MPAEVSVTLPEVVAEKRCGGRGLLRYGGPDVASRCPHSGLNLALAVQERSVGFQNADAAAPGVPESPPPGKA